MNLPMRRIDAALMFLGLVFLISAAPNTHAQSCVRSNVTHAEPAVRQLDDLKSEGCLGDQRCATPLCKDLTVFEEKWKGKPAERTASLEAAELFGKIRGSASALPQDQVGVNELVEMLDLWNNKFSAASAQEGRDLIAESTIPWKPHVLTLFSGTAYQIDLEQALNTSCTTSESCQQAFEGAAESYAHSIMVHRLLTTLLSTDMAAFGKDLQTLEQRWHAYHNESRAIFPWELWLNGWYYTPRKTGFSKPPNSQILFLHPSAGFVYQNHKDDQLNEAIILDVIGFYRWRWGGADGNKITKSFGLALAAAWDGVDVGYGISTHLSKSFSIGVMTDAQRNVSILLGVDMGNHLFDKQPAVNKLRRQLGSND